MRIWLGLILKITARTKSYHTTKTTIIHKIPRFTNEIITLLRVSPQISPRFLLTRSNIIRPPNVASQHIIAGAINLPDNNLQSLTSYNRGVLPGTRGHTRTYNIESISGKVQPGIGAKRIQQTESDSTDSLRIRIQLIIAVYAAMDKSGISGGTVCCSRSIHLRSMREAAYSARFVECQIFITFENAPSILKITPVFGIGLNRAEIRLCAFAVLGSSGGRSEDWHRSSHHRRRQR